MKIKLLSTLLIIPFVTFSQTEDMIPFPLNSDTDTEINVVDTDDDNDGVLDNDDVLPLDPNVNAPTIVLDTAFASDDAGLRNNTSSTANNNYNEIAQLKNDLRSFAIKIPVPANLDLNSATFELFTDSEDDPLTVYYLPVSTWSELTVTYNTMDFSGKQYLGITGVPSGGKYTFNLPLDILPTTGGDITLWLYDPLDPNNSNEFLYTKETDLQIPGSLQGDQAPRVIFNSNEVQPLRVESDQSAGIYEYVTGGQFEVGFRLTQAPTSTVYVPIAVSDPTLADINGAEYLEFNSSNWNVYQTMLIDPLAIGNFNVNIRPLHSNDPFFNGHNPLDLEDYAVQATDITNLGGWTVATGSTFSLNLVTISAVGSSTFTYRVSEGPSGLNVTEFGGAISFSPLNNQIGTHDVSIEVTDDQGNISILETTIIVTNGGVTDPTGYIVDLNASDDVNADGTAAHPYNDVADAVDAAVAASGGDILLRGGEFDIPSVIFITAAASPTQPVTIKPLNGEAVKINFDGRAAFQFTETSRNIVLEGIEIDGNTDVTDFWCIVGQSVWGEESIPRGGGLCVIADGEDLTIRDCYLHDAYQKGVEITGRYVNIEGCIMKSIATTSISGGHGIMRQQQGREFMDADVTGKYRWDINSNLIFNVEQRIYSWVPWKGFMEMVIDEGKPILIDDPRDSDGIPDTMTARITNNVVAFGSVDHIRLKSTPGLEVSNNTIFSETTNGDGITDKVGDTNTAQFTDFSFKNNVARTNTGTTIALEIDNGIAQDTVGGRVAEVSGNYAMGGTIKPDPYTGLTVLDPAGGELYIDPTNGNFRLNPGLGLPSTLGVDPLTLDTLDMVADRFGIDIKWDGWITDNLKLSQSILDNMPGVYDGIANNDTVLIEGSCHMNTSRTHLDCDVQPNTYWKAKFSTPSLPVPDTMQFRLNELYTEWYVEVEMDHPGYERIRWGCSNLKQDQVFQNDWLTHSQITADTNTVIYGPSNAFVVDGDILIEFKDHTPMVGDYFDLIIADTISTANTVGLFDTVMFKGFEPDTFTLEIVTIGDLQAVRLTIVDDACSLNVINTNDDGAGSLRAAIACAVDGDTIMIASELANDTIKLTSTKLIIDKDLTIMSLDNTVSVLNCIPSESIEVIATKDVSLENFTIISDMISNYGTLNCSDMIFKAKTADSHVVFSNQNSSNLIIDSSVRIE